MDKLKLSASAAALALLIGGGLTSAQAADYVEPAGCTLSGSVMAGYMYNWQENSLEGDEGELDDKDVDWDTPFGEGAGLVTCGGFNIQADVSYYAHSADVDEDDFDVDLDQTNSHIGGALFYRDPTSWAGGLGASWISQDVVGKDVDVFRVGLFGEFYLDDVFTLGASGYYYTSDGTDFAGELEVKDGDGFELAAWGRFYATPDFSLMLRGDALFADSDLEDVDGDLDGFAITGEAEYLVWDQGLSLFAGARYAERTLEFEDGDDQIEFETDDFQVFAGIKFYFGHQGTLVERHRTGTIDNTSVFNEKLPELFTSHLAGFINNEGGIVP